MLASPLSSQTSSISSGAADTRLLDSLSLGVAPGGVSTARTSTRARVASVAGLARLCRTSTMAAATASCLTLAACANPSAMTGPGAQSKAPTRASFNLVGGTTPTTPTTDNGDSDNWTLHEPRHEKKGREELDNDPKFVTSTETVFPVTETAYNTCRNELVVLNGYLRTRMRTETDPFDGLKFQLREWKDTRGVYGTVTYDEQYWDDDDKSYKTRTRVVKYHNRETLLDQFEVGPVGLPFRSHFESKMYLQREGPDPYYTKQVGDDLFVFVREVVKIGLDGVPYTKMEFRTECK